MTLYKYLSCSKHAFDILRNEKIRYTQPDFLNDPYEMKLNIREMFSERLYNEAVDLQCDKALLKNLTKQGKGNCVDRQTMKARALAKQNVGKLIFNDKLEVGIRRLFGILSLSACPDNLLMWSHYADEHRGFVLALNEQHFSLNSPTSDKDKFSRPRQVIYSDARSDIALLDIMEQPEFFFRKSNDWAYEQEWRIIKRISEGMRSEEKEDVFLFDLPANALQQVILGANTSVENREQLMEILKSQSKYRHIELCEAQLQKNVYALKIRQLGFHPIQYDCRTNLALYISDLEDRANAKILQDALGKAICDICLSGADIRPVKKLILQKELKLFDEEAVVASCSEWGTQYLFIGYMENEKISINLHLQLDDMLGFLGGDRETALCILQRSLLAMEHFVVRQGLYQDKKIDTNLRSMLAHFEMLIADICSEYYVSREGKALEGEDIDCTIYDLEQKFQCSQQEVTQIISKFKDRNDGDFLFKQLTPIVEDCMRSVAALMGMMERLDDERDDVHLACFDSFLFINMLNELHDIHRYFPHWESINDFEGVFAFLEAYLCNLGVTFEIGGNGTIRFSFI